MIDIETPQEIEVVSNGIDVEARSLDVEVVDLKELDVTVAKKEFVITGDDIYVPKLYDDAPQWMKDLVQIVVNSAVETNNMALISEINSTLSQFATSYVPLNQYTQSILDLSNEDVRINTVIETLNSNYNDGISNTNAQILNLENTKASKDEVIAQIVTTLRAQLDSPTSDLGATIGRIDQTIVNNQEANALSMEVLTASLEGVSGEIVANAEVVNNVLAYVGIDEAGASTNTGLSAYLEGNDGNFGSAGSQINNDIKVTAEGVESKWAYNSTVNINGVYKKSGFGLTTNYSSGSGTQNDPYVSEFWIDASRLKFTNSNNTGTATPFMIDASGSQPQVTFNGKVTFGSGQTGTIDEAIAAVVETVAVGDKNINITDNLIPVTSLVADTDNSGYQFVGTPTKSISSGLESFSETQIVLDGTDEVYSPYVDEVTIPYYYRFGIKGITSLSVFKIVTINTSNVITYNTVTVTMEPGQALNANNWYTVDGIINPVGGTTSADGDVRDSSGFKVGSVNNFAIASGSSKILLGWIANCTISRMKMCKITADTITSDFSSVNGQLVSLQSQVNDVSWNTLNGKDVFAQKLGYSTYAELETAATAGQTVIVGGHVNTNLIQANGIAASQINTTGLIADDIRANEIVGKTITGGVLNGAAINGAVIKASYIDLDGQLQVLTNYRISVAMYNSNPGLYTDAVYISGTNEYRIPSISTVRESTVNYVTNSVATYYGAISSYNTANAGNNLKAVKIRPIWNNQTQFQLFDSVCSDTWFGPGMYYGTHNRFRFRLGSVTLIEYKVDLVANGGSGEDDTTVITITGQNFSPIIVSVMSAQFPEYSNSYTVDIGIATVSLSISVINSLKSGFDPAPYPNEVKITGMLLSGSRETAFDWTNGKLQFDQIVAPSTTIAGNFEYTSIYGSTTFALNQSLSINNMI